MWLSLSEGDKPSKYLVTKAGGIEFFSERNVIAFGFSHRSRKALGTLARRLRSRTNAILRAPLTPKAVDAALGISARERLRWYKDGRLPTCGRGSIELGGQIAQYPLFPIDAIAVIASTEGLIETWRRDDRTSALGASVKDTDVKPADEDSGNG